MHEVETPDEAGASAVEYSLLVVAIAAVILLVVFALGGFVKEAFQGTCDTINQVSTIAASASCTP